MKLLQWCSVAELVSYPITQLTEVNRSVGVEMAY